MECSHLDQIKEVGIDYITLTHTTRTTNNGLDAFGSYLVQDQSKGGLRSAIFRLSGYRGEHCGQAAFGRRHDGCIVRLSGALANEHWSQAFQLATNVSRLDVQVTVVPHDGPQERLLRHHEELLGVYKRPGRKPKFKMWYGPTGPEAAILGRRVSDWFGRCYDKFLESRDPYYAGCLRYEAETKRRVAFALAAQFDEAKDQVASMLAVVEKFVSVRALTIPSWSKALFNNSTQAAGSRLVLKRQAACGHLCCDDLCRLLPDVARSNKSNKLPWLSNCVKPTIERLIKSGRLEEVLLALGLSEVVQPRSTAPRSTWSEFNEWRK